MILKRVGVHRGNKRVQHQCWSSWYFVFDAYEQKKTAFLASYFYVGNSGHHLDMRTGSAPKNFKKHVNFN